MLDEDATLPPAYEFDGAPQTGHIMPVTGGLYWLRMPLPMQLTHINLWLLADEGGWAIVDTGLYTEDSREIWKRTHDEFFEGQAPTRIFVTHLHPDHSGCAGWLHRKFGSPLWMPREEFLLSKLLIDQKDQKPSDFGRQFYKAAGFSDEQLPYYERMFSLFGSIVSPLPDAYMRLIDGATIRIGQHNWQVMMGHGHSYEHACLFCEDLNVLIAGDQLLPTISSNVSVYPTEPNADPLGDWLESLADFRRRLPRDVLVLPAHGKPFRGAHNRLAALTSEHEHVLKQLQDLCRKPRRAVDTFPALFKSRIDGRNLMMATGEAIAHLNYLLQRDRIEVVMDSHGVNWYQSL